MIDGRILRYAIIVGTTLQAANALIRHLGWLSDYYAQFGAMFISGVAGLLYAREVNKGYRHGAFAGAIAGLVSVSVGVTLAVTLHDVPPVMIPLAMLVCTLTGAIGGLFGQLGASIRTALYSKR
jgi:uncharacterized membrane protein YeaQ/YmgE (transglycosylase-associated protein family)